MFNTVVARTVAVDDQKSVSVFKRQQRMMPEIAAIIYALRAVGEKGVQVFRSDRVLDRRDDNQVRRIVQGNEGLGAKRMAFHHLDLDRPGPILATRLALEYADYRHTAIGAYINARQIVKPLGRALVDDQPFRAVGFDDIAKRREGRFG